MRALTVHLCFHTTEAMEAEVPGLSKHICSLHPDLKHEFSLAKKVYQMAKEA